MRKQDQLLHLIKSLSAAEKKYFKQYTDAGGGGKSYTALFDELQKSDSYDADKLSKKLKKTKKNLAHEKDHLQNVLLKTLRNFEGDRHVDSRLQDALTNSRMLSNKGQHDMALSIVRSAVKEAEYYERWDLLWRLLQSEGIILNGTDVPRPERIRLQIENVRRMENATAQLELLNRFADMHMRMDVIFERRREIRQTNDMELVKEMLQDPIMVKKYKTVLPQKCQLVMNSSISMYEGDYAKTLPYYKKLVELVEQYPEHTGFSLKEYFVMVHIYMSLLGHNEKYEELYRFLDMLKTKSFAKLNYNSSEAATLVLQYSIVQELFLNRKTGNAKKGLEAVDRLKANYDVYMCLPSLTERSSGLANAAKICYAAGKTEQCIYWLEKIFNDTDPSSFMEVHSMARILFSICHADLKNYTILPYQARNTERFLKKNNRYFEVEKLTLNLLKKLPSCLNDKERKEAYKQLLEDYYRLNSDKSAPNSFRMFDFIGWAERNAR